MDHLGAAFDHARGVLVVFHSGPASGARLWEWDGAAWRGIEEGTAEVTGGHRLAYDAQRARVLLWTALPDSPQQSRLLSWDGSAWSVVE